MGEALVFAGAWATFGWLAIVGSKQAGIHKEYDGTSRVSAGTIVTFTAYGPLALAIIMVALFMPELPDNTLVVQE